MEYKSPFASSPPAGAAALGSIMLIEVVLNLNPFLLQNPEQPKQERTSV